MTRCTTISAVKMDEAKLIYLDHLVVHSVAQLKVFGEGDGAFTILNTWLFILWHSSNKGMVRVMGLSSLIWHKRSAANTIKDILISECHMTK